MPCSVNSNGIDRYILKSLKIAQNIHYKSLSNAIFPPTLDKIIYSYGWRGYNDLVYASLGISLSITGLMRLPGGHKSNINGVGLLGIYQITADLFPGHEPRDLVLASEGL